MSPTANRQLKEYFETASGPDGLNRAEAVYDILSASAGVLLAGYGLEGARDMLLQLCNQTIQNMNAADLQLKERQRKTNNP